MENTHARFEATAELMAAALARLGVDARVGEVPREYCPGAYSVNAGGRRKLVGVGQRVIARAAHVGGVIIVAQSERVRAVLEPVYRALGLDWDPATAGAATSDNARPAVGARPRRYRASPTREPDPLLPKRLLSPRHIGGQATRTRDRSRRS